MSSEKMREEFESWAATHYVLMELSTDFQDGEYVEPDMQYASEAWQASRASLLIELPDDGIEDCQTAWGDRCRDTFDCGYNFASLRHEQAIEAAGVKVKS